MLKALFMGIPLGAVADIDSRGDDELAHGRGLIAERRAAGREISDDMTPVAGRSWRRHHASTTTTLRREADHANLRPPHPHERAHDRRLPAMYESGVRAVVEPSFWLGQPRTNVGSFVDYFDGLIGWERFRAAQYGIRHHCTIGLNPKEANDARCREVLDVLPRYLAKDGVVAVGELGYDSMTAEEDEVFAAQLALAVTFELPAMVHTPHRDKAAGTTRTLDVVRESGIAPERVVVDHLNETTVAAVADSGCWMGFSIYPDTKMDELRMVAILREFGTERVLVNSAADWGNSDPLKTRKTARAMLDAGFTEARRRCRALAEPGRLLRAERPPAPRPRAGVRRARAARGGRHLRGQLGAARGAGLMHLSYCTNVHPAEDLDGVLHQLDAFAGPVRRAAGLAELGVGLWLPADLAAQLAASADDRARLRERLDANGLTLRTINAFPYRAFHADVVKLDVYRPDWTDPRRAQYTLDCAAVLADLLPEGAAGSISTLPLGWREPWTADDDRQATAALAAVSRGLRALREATGRTVRLAIEPEPGCVLDTVADVVGWLEPRIAAGDDAIDPEFVGVCLDTCHLAVSFADPVDAVRRIGAAGLRVVKVQASAALHVERPSDPASRDAVAAFVEQRYLHQTRALRPDGSVDAADDLPEALETLPTDGPWRVHFHVPLHLAPRAPITATTEVLTAALDAVRELPHGDEAHLDVETYTWTVLPEPVDDLVAGIAGELRWASEHLLGTAPEPAHAASVPVEPVHAEVA